MGKYSALFMGASVMDLITYTQRFPAPGETVSGKHFRKGTGGKTSNACVMGVKLGLSAGLLAKNTIIYVPGPTNLLMPNEISERQSTLFRDCKLFVSTFECLPQTLLEALTLARSEGVKTMVNGAPPFPTPPPQRLYPLCDIFCVNETEGSIMTGIDINNTEDGRNACRILLERGCGSVILTLGSKGALYMDRTGDLYVPIEEKVTPVDTTGAGDAFMGALAYYMVCHPSLSIQEQIKRSCFIATQSVLKPGTQTSYPDKCQLPDHLFK